MSLNNEDKRKVNNKIDRMRRSLIMYDKYLAKIDKDSPSKEEQDMLDKILFLKKDKAREVYTILDKYGWLGPDDIGLESYNTIINSILLGDITTVLKIRPYVKDGFMKGKVSKEDLGKIFDYINTLSSNLIIQENKTLK